jgi:hypothetical protein
VAHERDRIGKQRDEAAMIEMGMRQEHMIHFRHPFHAQVTRSGAGIDQHIFVKQQRGGAPRTADAPVTAEYGKFHFPSGLPDKIRRLR